MSKVRTRPDGDFGIFLSFSQKAHNILPCISQRTRFFLLKIPGIMEFSSWKRFIMWSMLFVVQIGGACFDHRGYLMYWVQRLAKLRKTAELLVQTGQKRTNSVQGLYDKKTAPHNTVYLRSDEKKVCLKGWFTRHHQICRQHLLVK